jgi:2-dehydropantoate 2-reductase
MTSIVIAGAGSIGCYVGAALAAAGRDVTLLVRPARAAHIGVQGIRVSDLDGRNRMVPPVGLRLAADAPTALKHASLVLVCVKRGDSDAMGRDIAAHAPSTAIVLSLQNGIGNEEVLAPLVAPRPALPGVVMFNAVLDDQDTSKPLTVHRATSGGVYMPAGYDAVRAMLQVDGLDVLASPDMRAVAWGKLLLNLNNALNALSGLPLKEQLGSRPWRLLLAEQISEALAALQAAGIAPAHVGTVRPATIPMVLRLPDWIFKIAAARMLAIDPAARSSMWEDLERRRLTEIDYLQGAILALANTHSIAAPLTQRLSGLIKSAEAAMRGSPRLTPGAVRTALET